MCFLSTSGAQCRGNNNFKKISLPQNTIDGSKSYAMTSNLKHRLELNA